MSKVVVTKEKLVAIGDALRDKTETTEAYSLDEMPEVIQGIETGGGGGADFTISDASYLFYGGARLDMERELLSLLDKKLTNMSSMYNGCKNKTVIDVSSFDTSEVNDMSYLFYNCQNIQTVDVSNFNTSNATNMNSMFCSCSKLKSIDLSNFDTSNVTNLNQFFMSCNSLTKVDLSNFDTAKVTGMASIFSSCSMLEEIIGFSATNKPGVSITFPNSYSVSSKMALKRLTFRTDLPEGIYSIRSAINIKYCSFDREGMVEMFNTLPDITTANVSSSYNKITITGNPCVTDGTLTEEDKAIATNKGWTLVI